MAILAAFVPRYFATVAPLLVPVVAISQRPFALSAAVLLLLRLHVSVFAAALLRPSSFAFHLQTFLLGKGPRFHNACNVFSGRAVFFGRAVFRGDRSPLFRELNSRTWGRSMN